MVASRRTVDVANSRFFRCDGENVVDERYLASISDQKNGSNRVLQFLGSALEMACIKLPEDV